MINYELSFKIVCICFFSQYQHPVVTSLKEESSDESTVISSQTSTLTRNQGPDEMDEHGDDTLKLGTSLGLDKNEVDDMEEEEDENVSWLHV